MNCSEMLASGSSSSGEKRQQQAQGGNEKTKKGKCAGACKGGCKDGCTRECVVVPGRRKFTNKEEYKKWIKQGNGYARGFQPSVHQRAETLKDIDLPRGAPPEYHYDFEDLWMYYSRQLLSTNGMDLDTFPGDAEGVDAWPLDLKALCCTNKDLIRINALAELAIKEYNEESNFHKYELLKIEKVNLRETAYVEYFMTVKVTNLTLGTVYETFQIHAGQQGTYSKEVFSCLPKGGALPSVTEMEVSLNGEEWLAPEL